VSGLLAIDCPLLSRHWSSASAGSPDGPPPTKDRKKKPWRPQTEVFNRVHNATTQCTRVVCRKTRGATPRAKCVCVRTGPRCARKGGLAARTWPPPGPSLLIWYSRGPTGRAVPLVLASCARCARRR